MVRHRRRLYAGSIARPRIKPLLAALAVAAVAAGLVACGGGGGGGNAQKVIDATFSGHKKVSSGKIDLVLTVKATGVGGGSFDAKLSGPFEGKAKRFPKFDLTASLSGSGGGQNISFSGGLLSTGDSAFVNYQGTNYKIDDNTFGQFKSQYESQAATAGKKKSAANPFGRLGIHPKAWLTNLKDEGTATVGGAQTIHVSGDADVAKVIADLKKLLGSASKLGLPSTATLPDASQLDQVTKAIKSAHFDVFTGKDDKILRKLETTLTIQPPAKSGPSKVELHFSLTFSDLNKPQTVTAPSGAKPLADLLGKFSIGGFGGAGGGAVPGGGPSPDQSQKYLQCLQQASGQSAIADCAKVLQ
jgi:hypothetical protein